MGIRYYAYPVPGNCTSDAVAHPHRYLGKDPFLDAWGPLETRPEMLYLDNCWHLLQHVLGAPTSIPSRPSFRLIEGEVTPIHCGVAWRPFIRVLDPREVSVIAEDLDSVDSGLLKRAIEMQLHRTLQSDAEDLAYASAYLSEARSFTRAMADSGRGLIYAIC